MRPMVGFIATPVAAWDGFPVIEGAPATTVKDTASTTYNINLPTPTVAGDMLLALLAVPNNISFTWPSGWTSIMNVNEGGNLCMEARFKIATGSDGSSINVTSGNSQPHAAICYRLSHALTSVTPNSASGSNTSGNPNPPVLNLTGGSQKALWIAGCTRQGNPAPTGYPANYTLNQQNVPNSGAHILAAALRKFEAATEDPGNFTFASTSFRQTNFTIGVRPA